MSSDLSIEERKEVGLLILDEIDRVSKILGIKYYLAYGTLLGAIRHNGYIPWDDDVDIWMKRSDFDLFLEKFNDLCSKEFKVLSWKTDDDYTVFMPKVVYLKTTVRERWTKKPCKDLGVWVDLFALNSISEEEWKSGLSDKMYTLELYRRAAQFRYMCFFSKLDILRMIFKNRGRGALKCIFKKPSDYTPLLYDEMKDRKGSETFIPVDRLLRGGAVLDSSWFDEIIEHEYEDRMYPIPAKYKEILENLYGDYMTLPPEKERRLTQHIAYVRWKD